MYLKLYHCCFFGKVCNIASLDKKPLIKCGSKPFFGLYILHRSEWVIIGLHITQGKWVIFHEQLRHISSLCSAVDSSPGPAVSKTTQLYNILIIMHVNELNRSRDPLTDFASTLVCLAAILIILVNGMLCVFLIRDSRLWALVRSDFVLGYVNWNCWNIL